MFKKLFIFILSIIILGFGGSGVYFYFTTKPKYEGTVQLKGLKEKVTVVRDQYGIPHIEAQNPQDLYRAYGYVVASDRLFQIQLFKRLAQGRLSELLGSSVSEIDILFRTLRFQKSAEEFLAHNQSGMNAQMLRDIEAFSKGIQDFIDEGRWPIEFTLLNFTPEPITLLDIISFSGYMGFSFSSGMRVDSLMTHLLDKVPQKQLEELRGATELTSNHIQKVSAMQKSLDWMGAFLNLNEIHNTYGSFDGSNSWVVSPTRSQSGFAMLANDPHISFSNPGMWYEAHLKYPGYEIYGNFLSIIPFALIGHNQNKAWALTMSDVDDMDLYQEKLNDQGQVMFKGEWVALQQYTEKIKVRMGDTIELPMQVTPHGPIVDRILKTKNQNVALKWLYYEKDNNTIEAIYDLNHAQDLESYKRAIQKGAAPGLNISYADKAGNIAWWTFGQIPIRPQGTAHDLILDGASGKDEYLGFVPFEERPHSVNPQEGLIISANQKPPVNFDEQKIKGYWEPTDRYDAISEYFEKLSERSSTKLTVDDMKQAQQIDLLFATRDIKNILLKNLYDNTKTKYSALVQEFENWDGHGNKNSVSMTLFWMWTEKVMEQTVLPTMGQNAYEIFCSTPAPYWNAFKSMMRNPQSAWWSEKMNLKIDLAFQEAIKELETKYGTSTSNWKWGKVHQLTYPHPLGKIGPLKHIFNVGPFEVGGGYMIPNAMRMPFCKDDYNVTSGASVRRVIDFKNPEISYSILPIGVSGNLFSPFYKDQAEMFVDGDYREQWMSAKDIQANQKYELILAP